MALFKLDADDLVELQMTEFVREGIRERGDLQRLLRDKPEAIERGLFIVADEFGHWEESRRRIDLLGLDSEGNLDSLVKTRFEEVPAI